MNGGPLENFVLSQQDDSSRLPSLAVTDSSAYYLGLKRYNRKMKQREKPANQGSSFSINELATFHGPNSSELIAGHVLSSPAMAISRFSDPSRRDPVYDYPVSSASSHDVREKCKSWRKSRSRSLVERLNAKKTMAEISIPGMRAIFGRNAHIARRIIWILIVVTCFTIAAVQVQDRVAYFMSTPVTVLVKAACNNSLRFPVVSLCNKNLFNMTAVNILKTEKAAEVLSRENVSVPENVIANWDVPDLVGVRGYDVRQIWDFTAHSIERMVYECWFGRNITCESRGQWKKNYNYMGICYTYELYNSFVPISGMFNNLYLKMIDQEREVYRGDNSGWKMLIHDRKDTPLIDLRTHGTTLYRGWAKDIRIYVREFRTLNVNHRPCNTSEDYSYSKCIAKCFNNNIYHKIPCILPYIDPRQTDSKITKPYCNNSEDYKKTIKTIEGLLFYGGWSSNNCACERQCNQNIYVPYTETMQMQAADASLTKLRVFYQDMCFDDIEEILTYTLIPLLCDIGGSLGLLLGASVLTFFEIIEAMSAALVHIAHRFCLVIHRSQEMRQERSRF